MHSPKKTNSTTSSGAPRILVVDDEAHLRELLEITLIKMGMDVDSAENLASARRYFAQHTYSLVLTDMRLPDGLGLELVEEITQSAKTTPVAVITAFGSADNAVVALKAGAFDYVSKPVALDQLRKLVQSALHVGNAKLTADKEVNPASRLLGESLAIRDLRAQISRLARSMAPVSIFGESGSGKELAAREIHAQSARSCKPFVAVNCGAIPEALMEAEFFGYRKGAFTGATEERDGFFQAANGGTLLLDEVAELPLAMQVKLLRAIQERAVRKIGATSEEMVDVRIISATHQNLEECVVNKRFRQDLYYRLNVIELKLPSLRERRDDIPVLSEGILQRLSGKAVALSPPALQALLNYDFPGNVRELENILERALAFANDGQIELADLALKPIHSEVQTVLPVLDADMVDVAPSANAPLETVAEPFVPVFAPHEIKQPGSGGIAPGQEAFVQAKAQTQVQAQDEVIMQEKPLVEKTPVDAYNDLPQSLPAYLEQVEREIILRALKKTGFNKTQAAELLGISFRQLRYQIQKLHIQEPE